MDALDSLVAELRSARERQGLSLSAASQRSGYSVASIVRWEAARARPNTLALATWADSLGFTLTLAPKAEA